MSGEIHGAVVIEPNTISEIGSVASSGEGAIVRPAKPPTTKSIGICAPKIAWAMTKTITLRLARASFVDGSTIAVMLLSYSLPSTASSAGHSGAIKCANDPLTAPSRRPIADNLVPSASWAVNNGSPFALTVVA